MLVLPLLYQVSSHNIIFIVFVSCEFEILLNSSVSVILLVETVVRNSDSSYFLLNFHRFFTSTVDCKSTVGVTRLLAAQRHAVVQLVEALRYKPEGREFYSRRCH